MRVICIILASTEITGGIKTPLSGNNLVIGKEYNAEISDVYNDCYLIEGHKWENGKIIHWGQELFAPLSEIDEKELSHAEPIESTFILKDKKRQD